MRKLKAYGLLRFCYFFLDKGLSCIMGKNFDFIRINFKRFSYRIKIWLFPEYGTYAPTSVMSSPSINTVWLPPSIPEWVLSEMKVLGHEVDPRLYPDATFIANCQYFSFPVIPKPGAVYKELALLCKSNSYSHCFAIPWLKHGGADLLAIKHIEIANNIPGAKVLVLLTEPGESPWLSRLSKEIDVLDVAKYVPEISHDELIIVITRLLVQLKIGVLHVINSRHVWEVICKYGLPIKQNTKIFASVYCDDFDKNGIPVGFARQYLENCYKHIARVFCDNTVYRDVLCGTYGYPTELFQVLNTPVSDTFIERVNIQRASMTRGNVLWAGRLDRQKRPDLLLAIARKLPNVKFTVFGTGSIAAMSDVIDDLKRLSNVVMMGSYDGSETLPFADNDVFLYTSQWDGMPIMVLEAVFAEIPVIASNAGGVKDVINEQTGYLVQDIENIDDYVEKIEYVMGNLQDRELRSLNAKKLVQTVHSKRNFEIELKQCYLN